MKLLHIIYPIVISCFFIGCTYKTDRVQFDEGVDSFAYYYFNSQYPKAIPFCTPESKKWLQYASSQMTQADIDVLKELPEGASYEIGINSYNENDTATSVEIIASNYLLMDTIGGAGRMVDEKSYIFQLRKRNGKWLVHIDGLPTH